MIDLREQLDGTTWRVLSTVIGWGLSGRSPKDFSGAFDGSDAVPAKKMMGLFQKDRAWKLAEMIDGGQNVTAQTVTLVVNGGGLQNRSFETDLKAVFKGRIAPRLAALAGSGEPVTGRIVGHFDGHSLREATLFLK